jgi:trimethylamine monooxygenase
MTGTVAPVHHTPWLTAFDDSIACYVDQNRPRMEGKRVCIIGAGPSGTAALRAFQSAAAKGAEIPEIVCFEKQRTPGGLWNFNHKVGYDEHSQLIHNSMYRHLWSNGPKECLEFADYGFEEHFGTPIPSFPPREVLFDYIMGRIKKSGVEDWIRCSTAVLNCAYDATSEKFTVRVCHQPTGEETEEKFDWVICASGHFSTPNYPEFEGMETFTGRVLHAHDYRNAEEFSGKDVLVIGTSYSAEDIASQCYKFGAKSLTLSWRTKPMGFHWPDNFKTVPLLQKVAGRTCTFKDGSTADVDAIILCTGYQHHFPFMAKDLRLSTANRLCCDRLHEGVVWPDNNRLFYMGMQDQWLTFNMFDAQAWYARDVILGRINLPDRAIMDKEWAECRAKEDSLSGTDESMIRHQADYVKHLIKKTDYPMFDIEGVVQEFLAWEHNKHENIMTFRDKPHKSVMTGTVAPVHHTPWLTAFDDSIACYVDQNKPLSR